MLLKTIMFDSNNFYWENNRDVNFAFLTHIENYLNDRIRHRGYVYLKQICEQLGERWNTDDENMCIKCDDKDRIAYIQFELFEKENNAFLVHILCYD